MKKTIDFLVALPKDEQRRMSQAQNFTFTRDSDFGIEPASYPPNVHVVQADTMRALRLAVHWRAEKPMVLSFAHGYNAGGGFEHSGGSQEEAIWRSSSIFLSIWPHRRADDGAGVLARGDWIGEYDGSLPRRQAFYPHTECGLIYSPYVRAVRRSHGGEAVGLEDDTFAVI